MKLPGRLNLLDKVQEIELERQTNTRFSQDYNGEVRGGSSYLSRRNCMHLCIDSRTLQARAAEYSVKQCTTAAKRVAISAMKAEKLQLATATFVAAQALIDPRMLYKKSCDK